MDFRKYAAEAIGTFILVFIGTLSIVAATKMGAPVLGVVPFGFGLGLFAAIYAVGDVSGAHYNPAVTLGAFLDRRTSALDLGGYWVGQAIGALVASGVVALVFDQATAASTANAHPTLTDGAAFLLEAVLTAVFVLVILTSTKRWPREAPLVIALTLASIHFADIPFSGASVNPARSLGPAIIGSATDGLWLYLVAPLVGAAVGWGIYRFVHAPAR